MTLQCAASARQGDERGTKLAAWGTIATVSPPPVGLTNTLVEATHCNVVAKRVTAASAINVKRADKHARSFRARWLLLHRGQAWQSEGRAAFTGKALFVNYSVVGSGVHTVMRLAAASSGDRIGQLADLNGAPFAFPDSAAAHNRTLVLAQRDQ